MMLLSWDVTLTHPIDFDFIENEWLALSSDTSSNSSHPCIQFLSEISQMSIRKSKDVKAKWSNLGYMMPDPLVSDMM